MRLIAMVAGVGLAQIASWGSLFYAIGVLGKPMREELGVSELFLFSAFTAGLLVSGTAAPFVGRWIDRYGGRVVLSFGSIAASIALLVLAIAPNAPVLVLGWLLAGAAMAATLYDPAFSTLSQHAGAHYRRSVTALTLLGGFASTVFWPLSHLLLQEWGWRVTLAAYAGLQVAMCLPLHLLLVPARAAASHASEAAAPPMAQSPGLSDPRLKWLTASFAVGTFIAAVVAVHMVGLLSGAGLTAAEAVTISMLMGPMQVVGRIIEISFASRVRAVTVGIAAFALITTALLLLMATTGFGPTAILFVVAFGFGNGVLTIVKGTAPAELFGRDGMGALLGYLSRAAFYAKALAPAALPALLTAGLTRNGALATFVGIAVAGLLCYRVATRERPPEPRARRA
ncbi:MAG TPA: MFS transporter [Usitatibacter sp.]|nr:MFS transporter [Usitatibacter sp.]